MKGILTAAIMMFMLQLAGTADAASVVVDRVGTSNVYIVRGYDFVDVGGVEIEIQYDTATLSNPTITQGSMLASTMFIPNPKFSASSVKLAAMSLSAIKGSGGELATITFDLKSENPGAVFVSRVKMSSLTANKITPVDETTAAAIAKEKAEADARAAALKAERLAAEAKAALEADRVAAEARAKNAADLQTIADAAAVAATERVRAAEVRAGTYAAATGSPSVGTITLPADQIASAEAAGKTDYQPLVTDLRKDMAQPLGDSASQQSSPGEQAIEPVKELQKKSVTYKSTVQLFKDFKGAKSSKSLIPLFAENAITGFRQEPPIAFADGKTPLRVSLVIKQTGSESPKFLLQGANVKQISGEGEDAITWTIDAVPKKNAVEAILTVVDGKVVMEIPLTIVPRIDAQLAKGKALSEADFAAYLAVPAKFDLNKDGKFDAVDDFIYTANYIVAMKIKPEKARPEEKAAAPKQGVKDEPKSKEPIKAKDEKVKPVEKPAVKPAVKP